MTRISHACRIATLALLPAISWSAAGAEGQLISAGYAAPGPVEVAPGQILTLFLRGIARSPAGGLRIAQAQSVPLPDTLAGLSVSIQQSPQTTAHRLPLLSVRQHNECEEASGEPRCLLTALRVQIHTNLTPVIAKLTVETDGEPTRTFLIRPIRDDAHLVTACDLTWDTNPGSDCPRIAFHADGAPVDQRRPVRPGESIILYAHGLGPTSPPVPAGTASPAGAALIEAVASRLRLRFLAFRNAAPSLPRYYETTPEGEEAPVSFAGLTPGQVGLYQINVVVPTSLTIPIRCGGDTRSNVLLKVETARGIENVALCVE